METQNLENFLKSFGDNVVKKAKANLQKAKGSTALGESIRFKVVPTEQGFTVIQQKDLLLIFYLSG